MRLLRTGLFVLCLVAFWPRAALAWWESTLQQVDIAVTLKPDGQARVAYDLRYHVDRGRFEGVQISNPGRIIQWDRMASFIEDSRGRRYPVRLMRRGRDGAYLVRLARGPGLRRGWVTVHLEYDDNLMDCCLRLEPEGRVRLDWSAFSWRTGMDRMTVTFRLDPGTDGLEADSTTSTDFTVEPTEDQGLLVEKIQPVRWFEMNVGLLLPEGWMQHRPQAIVAIDDRPLVGADEPAVVAPTQVNDQEVDQNLASLVFALVALGCLLLLAIKGWATNAGYHGSAGPAPPLILPKVPPLMRWAFAGGALMAGAWLQSASFLAAGTLSFAAGVVLTLRGPVRVLPRREQALSWRAETVDKLALLARRRSGGRRRWAVVLDGSSLAGLPLGLAVIAGSAALVYWLHAELGRQIVDGLAIDLALTLAAFVYTARHRDVVPGEPAQAAALLDRLSRKLAKAAAKWGSQTTAMVGSREAEDLGGAALESCSKQTALPAEVRLTLQPAPAGTEKVTITTEPELGVRGWSLGLVATIKLADADPVTVRAGRPGALARRLRRRIKKAEKRARKS